MPDWLPVGPIVFWWLAAFSVPMFLGAIAMGAQVTLDRVEPDARRRVERARSVMQVPMQTLGQPAPGSGLFRDTEEDREGAIHFDHRR